MSIVRVPLEVIVPNPWQTRREMDQAYIAELAEDITKNGLLQTPVGRLVREDGTLLTREETAAVGLTDQRVKVLVSQRLRVQLAFGHNRLMAFWLNAGERGAGWGRMPVEIRRLTDEQMADYAWAENERRRDVSPIDRARAIQQRMEDFGWTQEQAAERLKMSRPAVANILRLLRLPKDLQQEVQDGALSERQALAVLPLTELPEVVLNKAQNRGYQTPEDVLAAARRGESSDQIRRQVRTVIEWNTEPLDKAIWPLDHVFMIENVTAPACNECDKRIQSGKKQRCPVESCYELKKEAWQRLRVEEASKATGIPAVRGEHETEWSVAERFGGKQEFAQKIQGMGCENLRLRYEDTTDWYPNLKEAGFPDVALMCLHGEDGKCECLKKLKAEHERNDPEIQAKRAEEAEIERMFQAATQAVFQALSANEIGIWRLLLGVIDYRFRENAGELTLEQIHQKMAEALVRGGYYPNKAAVQKHLQEILEIAGLPALEMPNEAGKLLERWRRIEGWMNGLHRERPTLEQVRGNIDNLARLAEEVREFDGEELEPLRGEALDEAIIRLQNLELLLSSPYWSEDGFEKVEMLVAFDVETLVFKAALSEAPAHVLAYALDITSGRDGHGLRAGKIRAQLNGQAAELGLAELV